MKPFVFKDVEYKDLNSLGLAFAENFKDAMEAVKSKSFIKFIKHFKKHYDKIVDILYSNRYLQNVITLIIYTITNEHKFVVFGNAYNSLSEVYKDVDTAGFKLLLSENGFSKTIINTVNDQKIKQDLLTFESNYEDEFAIKYFKDYFKYDSIETLETSLSEIYNNTDENFRRAQELFSSEKVQMLIAHKYSLELVLKLRRESSPVFMGLEIIQADMEMDLMRSILENGFYYFLSDNLKEYKFKGKYKNIKKKLISLRKDIKKNKKPTANFLCSKCREMYNLYILTVEGYEEGKVKVKNENFAFTANYANTLIPVAYVSCHSVKLSDENNVKIKSQEEIQTYDLNRFDKLIRKYRRFNRMGTFLFILFGLYLGASYILANFEIIDITVFSRTEGDLFPLITFASGLGAMLIFMILISIKVKRNIKRYYSLCKLKYYRNNRLILTDKEITHLGKLEEKEFKFAKKLNKGCRLFAGLVLAGLAASSAMLAITLCHKFDILTMNIYFDNIYYAFIPALAAFLLSVLRKKKSGFSVLLWFLLSAALTVGLTFILA